MNLNTISQLIYDELIHCNFEVDQNYFNILNELRNILIKNGDSLVCMKIGNTNLLMNLSHQMPLYAAYAPLWKRQSPHWLIITWRASGRTMRWDSQSLLALDMSNTSLENRCSYCSI